MRVLLKDAAEKATAENILVPPQRTVASLATLSGATAPFGFLADADYDTVVKAIQAGSRRRAGEFRFSIQSMSQDLRKLAEELGNYELGSKLSLRVKGDGYVLEDGEATRIDRSGGLTWEDRVAIGPSVSPKAFMNARGRVEYIRCDNTVEVELDASDRDRIERATGKRVPKVRKFPRACIEKLREVKD